VCLLRAFFVRRFTAEILDTGRLVLNENHRNEITIFMKTIADFVEIKRN
jgi:hypothetical protein